jgi:tyrosine-protein kinase Etk/Wzc
MSQNQNLNDDTIDLKELFFSLISQWKIIALCIILSLICAVLFLRTTPEIYSVDALVQVEDSKGAASAALLGSLGDIPGISGQKSLADAEKEVLNSRMVLGKVISNLNLDIQLKDSQDGLIHRLLSNKQPLIEYSSQGVFFLSKTNLFISKN